MICEKISVVRRRYGQKIGKARCDKPAVLQTDNGTCYCHNHFNSWFKKVNPKGYWQIVNDEKTTPALFYLKQIPTLEQTQL